VKKSLTLSRARIITVMRTKGMARIHYEEGKEVRKGGKKKGSTKVSQ